MVLWGVVFLAILAGVSASSRDIVFPETYNERSLASRQGARIVSGWEADEGQFPHQLSIRMVSARGGVSSCGASIIHEEWGITAAHCTAGFVTFVIRAGVLHLTKPALLFETTEYYNHPNFNSNYPDYVQAHDIALFKFGLKLEFNSLLSPIRLQPSVHDNRDYTDEVLIVSGWGSTGSSGASPEHLNWVYLRGISNQRCRWWYNSNVIVDSTICAQYYNVTSQSPCHGDSGGPLIVRDVDGRLSQVGVASFVGGAGCHTVDPAGFIRPGHYHKWITEITGEDLDWDPEAAASESDEESESSDSQSESSDSDNQSENSDSDSSNDDD